MAVAGGPRTAIDICNVPARHAATIRAIVSPDRLPAELDRMFGTVMEAVGRQGLAAAGAPFARFHRISRVIDVEAGIPLVQPIAARGDVRPSRRPAGPCLHATCPGTGHPPCSTVHALEAYAARHGLTEREGFWECYEARSTLRSSHRQHCTDIFLPVERR